MVITDENILLGTQWYTFSFNVNGGQVGWRIGVPRDWYKMPKGASMWSRQLYRKRFTYRYSQTFIHTYITELTFYRDILLFSLTRI